MEGMEEEGARGGRCVAGGNSVAGSMEVLYSDTFSSFSFRYGPNSGRLCGVCVCVCVCQAMCIFLALPFLRSL